MSEADDDSMRTAVIYLAYGEIMHALQVLEFDLWTIQSLRMKPGIQHEQALRKVEAWDGSTLGQLWGGMRNQKHWPAGLVEEIDWVLLLRNKLAHKFLREYFLVTPSQEAFDSVTADLADWAVRVEAVGAALGERIDSLGGTGWDELSDDVKAEVDALRPSDWPP